jgi:hypothetical protein
MDVSSQKVTKKFIRDMCTINLGYIEFFRCPISILLIVVVSLTSFPGCGSSKKTATPEQKEELRQKMIKNAERERREG